MENGIKVLFIGETWQGSSARSMREALQQVPGIVIDEIGEDHYLPKYQSLLLRVCNRVLKNWQMAELACEVRTRVAKFAPDVIVIYKGHGVTVKLLAELAKSEIPLVNIFPDYSPHAFGANLKDAIGYYDLVISTKNYHAQKWESVYGYRNRCVCVAHGYDPEVHYWPDPPVVQDLDVVIAASWRPEYHELLLGFASALGEGAISVGVAGPGWFERRHEFPLTWSFEGAPFGRSYGAWVRRGKIAIAPVHTRVMISGQLQPGDEDTTRSYELAAAGCFFLHRRTPYIQTVYDEETEVPMWSDPVELAQLVKRYLPLEAERRAMATRAHQRAVPAYSIPARAQRVYEYLDELATRRAGNASS